VSREVRLRELQSLPRIPLEVVGSDGEHNRVGGLIEMIQDNLGSNSIVMELGTGLGISTETFALHCALVHSVDVCSEGHPWRIVAEAMSKRYANVRLYHEDSSNLIRCFPDNFFDTVYIDALHGYHVVKRDIALWKTKVRSFICGHDYFDKFKGVIQAVNEAFGQPDRVYKDTSWVVYRKERW
jgi:hypothetical protein